MSRSTHRRVRRSTAVVVVLAVFAVVSPVGATASLSGDASEPTEGSTTTTVEPAVTETSGESGATVEGDESLSDEVVVRLITFPVVGPVAYFDDWGNCRDHCERRHAGNDLIGQRLQPIVAPEDGVIERLSVSSTGGHCLRLGLADGWAWVFCHLNNDTPGTDDGANADWITPKGLTVGSKVKAGTVVGFMGDSGNSEMSVPHLHLELVNPAGERRNPYPTLQLAEADRFCVTSRAGSAGDDTEAGLGRSWQLLTFNEGGWMMVDQIGGYAALGAAQWTGRSAGCVPGPFPDIDLDAWPQRPEKLLLRGFR